MLVRAERLDEALGRLLDAGLMATVNSDDPAYFGGYIADNYLAAQAALKLTRDDLVTLARNSIASGKLPDPRTVRVEEFVNYFQQDYASPPDVAFALYADGAPPATARRASLDGWLRDLTELKISDPVVHENHGIGRYLGLTHLDLGEGETEAALLPGLRVAAAD